MPIGVRVAHSDTSTVTTEWFTTLADRAAWVAQARNVTIEPRPLVRLTDDDERGIELGEHEVISLHALADKAREETRQAGLRHAAIQHRIVAAELRAVWRPAAVVVADLAAALAGEGNPFIEEIRDATGAALWTQDTCVDAVNRAELQLSAALDFADANAVGWRPLTAAQLADWTRVTTEMGEYYALKLPLESPLAERV